ncbi:MAG: hypothetical protein KR126chlam3_00493 [Chlamydiae bacterium]|nr:hypothetical protein [Chlamydiota bacterium]
MKKFLPLFLLLCSFNRIDFNSIMLGTPAPQVVNRYGEPYAVHDLGKNNYEYEYIERVSMNNELMYENHYFLTIEGGKVVSKCFREQTRPGYDQLWQPDPNYPSYP